VADVTRTIGVRCLRYLTDRPGEVVYVEQLAEQLGVTTRQVSQAMYNMLVRNQKLADEVEVVVRAQAWRYRPNRGYTRPSTERVDAPVDASIEPSTSTTSAGSHPRTRARSTGARSSSSTTSRYFEEVRKLPNDELLLVDENGKLYRAKELEL